MKKNTLLNRSFLALLVLLAGACGHAYASVPEIDPTTATSGLVLLAGVVLMVRGRRR